MDSHLPVFGDDYNALVTYPAGTERGQCQEKERAESAGYSRRQKPDRDLGFDDSGEDQKAPMREEEPGVAPIISISCSCAAAVG